ncbi:MAG: polysulfide reductase NrfD, partial [Desulfobulbaceae bacterium]|nr:polysulfide reductase NrfD [Desulfobulbaceae bacterium]
MNTQSIIHDDNDLFRSIEETSVGFYWMVGILVFIIIFALYTFANQVFVGLGVTGLGQTVSWGFYIVNFVFFIGISHAGTLISAILRLSKAEWRRPITRMA